MTFNEQFIKLKWMRKDAMFIHLLHECAVIYLYDD